VIVATAVVGAVVAVVVPVPVPNTAPPPPSPVVVAVAMSREPVHVAPVGQHAMFLALSVVQKEPAVQHAPPAESRNVLQELKFTGQLPSRLRRSFSCSWGKVERDSLERSSESEMCGW